MTRRSLAALAVLLASACGSNVADEGAAHTAAFRVTKLGNAVAGAQVTFTVTALDSRGGVNPGYRGTVLLATDDTRSTALPEATFGQADAGQITTKVIFETAGARTFVVVDKANPSALGLVHLSVAPGPPARVTLEGLPAQIAVDVVQSVTVTVRDALENPVTDYAGTLRFASSDAMGSSVPDTTFVPADLGVKVVTVQFGTSGPQSLSASDLASPSIAGSTSTQVLHGPAAGLVLSGIPPATLSGTPLTVGVAAADAHGNVATDFAGTVHFVSTDPKAALPPDYAFSAADQGSHTFAIVLTTPGTSTITATSAGLPASVASVTVHESAAAQVRLEGLPAQVAADAVQSVTVRVLDALGNPVTDYTGTLHFTNSDGQASAVPDLTFSPLDAGAKVVSLQFGTAGTQTVSASDTVFPQIKGSTTTQVVHGPAALLLLNGVPPSTVAGTLLTFAVTAVDRHGNVVTDFAGIVHFTSTDPKAQLQPDAAFSAADKGVKSFSAVLDTAGAQSITVSQVGGGAASATANVAVVNAPASRMTLDAHTPRITVDTNEVFTVTVRDRFGNPALDYTGTVHFVLTDTGATVINDLTFTAAMFATADVTTGFGTAGDQSLIATDARDPTITGSTAVQVTNGPARVYALSALPLSAIAGEPLSLGITAVDAHGNVALDYAGSAAITSTDPSDRLPAAGPFVNGVRNVSLAFVSSGLHHATVSDTLGLFQADTSEVTILSGDASALIVGSASTTAGVATPASVTAKDGFGNVVASYRGSVTLTSTDPQTILPPAYTFTATDAGQHTFSVTLKAAGTSSVNANDGLISGTAAFAVAPAAASNCDLAIIGKAGAEVGLRVKVMDPFANLATTYAGTLAFASSDPQAQLPAPATYARGDGGSRDFTAVLPTPGDQTIRATDSSAAFTCQGNVSIVTAQFFAVTFDGAEAWAGSPRTVTVQAQDANGIPIANYAGTIAFSSADPATSLPPDVTLTGTEGGHTSVSVTFNTIGLQTFTAKDGADPTRTGSAFQLVHGLSYTDPPAGGKVRLVLNGTTRSASVVQLDLVSNTSLFPLGVADPKAVGRVLPSSLRNGAFAAGMNLPIDSAKIGPGAQLLVLAPPTSAVLSLGAAPLAAGAAFANGVLYSGISQKRLDVSLNCPLPCTNDHMRGDVQVRPFPGASSLYYSLRLKLTAGAAPGTIFDGQALASDTRFRAAVRDRSGSDVFSGTADFAIGKLEVK